MVDYMYDIGTYGHYMHAKVFVIGDSALIKHTPPKNYGFGILSNFEQRKKECGHEIALKTSIFFLWSNG
jgi:hypothetical protein